VIWIRAKVLLIAAILLIAPITLSQKETEKPKLHTDFHFGVYPVLREAPSLLAQANAKLLIVGFHQKWDIEKIAKESKVAGVELDRIFTDLEDARLVFEVDQYERRPMLPVIRDRDIAKVQRSLQIHTTEFTNLLKASLPEIETAIVPMTGAKEVPMAQLMYQVVAGAIVFGGMHDAFFEDQTIMTTPTRRVGSQRYYAWLVESDPARAGILKREQWESDGYTVVSIGKGLAPSRMSLERIRAEHGMVLDEAESRRFRSFILTFTKERLLPHFKKNRASFLNALNELDAGKYVSVSSAFAWYYDQIANGVVENLASAKLIQSPAAQYAFALKVPGPR
jgi:hypothetical protein